MNGESDGCYPQFRRSIRIEENCENQKTIRSALILIGSLPEKRRSFPLVQITEEPRCSQYRIQKRPREKYRSGTGERVRHNGGRDIDEDNPANDIVLVRYRTAAPPTDARESCDPIAERLR